MLGQVTHRFARNPNYVSSHYNRAGNRHDPFGNTLRILNDPKNNRTLYLIGTTNSSTMLAQRTKKLIEAEKPDTVFVQTNKKWWKTIQNIKNVNNQSELNYYNYDLMKSYDFESYIENGPRDLVFKFKLYFWLYGINWFKAFPTDFHPFIPGLEMKYAMETAEALGKNIVLGGLAIDEKALFSMKVETRLDVFQLYRKAVFSMYHNSLWTGEHHDHYACLDVLGGDAFSESIDYYRLNWFIKYFEKIAPHQKKILVDQKDIELFYALYRNCPGKKIVAVVNQWHLPGIETHWRHTTGTVEEKQAINPIGNMDINKFQEEQLVNDTLRAITSKLTKSEPASWKNYSTVYHKDNYEYERVRHIEFQSHDDPHIYHGLPYEYDDNMQKIHLDHNDHHSEQVEHKKH